MPQAEKVLSVRTQVIKDWYFKQLLTFREKNGPTLMLYLGSKWFAIKVLLGLIAGWIFLSRPENMEFGYLLTGYLIGTISATVRHALSLKRIWPLQREIINWRILEDHQAGS